MTKRQSMGVDSNEVAERLRIACPNCFPTRRPSPLWRQGAAQMLHFFAIMAR